MTLGRSTFALAALAALVWAGCGSEPGEPPIKVIPGGGGSGAEGGTGSGAQAGAGGSAAGSGTGGSAAGSGSGGSAAGSGTGGSGTGGSGTGGSGTGGSGTGGSGTGGSGTGGSGTGGSGGSGDPCFGNCTAAGATCQSDGECTCGAGNIDINPAKSSANCVSSKIKGIEVGVAITHDTVGQLTIKLRGPDGTVITFASRPGLAEWDDKGTDVMQWGVVQQGALANMELATMIFFNDTASVLGEDIGKGLSTNQVVGLSPPDTFRPDRGKAIGPTTLASAFVGKFADGQWSMCVGDSVAEPFGTPQPEGALDKWRLNLQLEFTTSDNTYYANKLIPDDGYNGQLTSMACSNINLK